MKITDLIEQHNDTRDFRHQTLWRRFCEDHPNADNLAAKLAAFHVALPSWALGTGGTRFGRFSQGGEPRNLEEKIEDAGLVHALSRSCQSISLHIPWDQPEDPEYYRQMASAQGLHFDAVNSNTFQDQPDQRYSYKFGSLQHTDPAVRRQAVQHHLEVINIGIGLGSKALTVWLADGSSYPGQLDFQRAFHLTLEGLKEIYEALPEDWSMYIEYKAFEPHFYSMTVGDWGQALLYSQKLGPKALTLVDLGHHLPNANIEQIVALLMMESKLGGFHFNDSKYGDDDLTAGSLKPYQLFLIFNELVRGIGIEGSRDSGQIAWMIDASHNLKDPLEDLLQSVEAIRIAYAQALLVDREKLAVAQKENDPVQCQELLQDAFRSDVRPLLAEVRRRSGGAIDPLQFFRENRLRDQLITRRGRESKASGL